MDEVFIIEERARMGNIVLTLYENDMPLGSFFLDPARHSYQIESIRQLVKSWESHRIKEAERERVRQDGSSRRRNDQQPE